MPRAPVPPRARLRGVATLLALLVPAASAAQGSFRLVEPSGRDWRDEPLTLPVPLDGPGPYRTLAGGEPVPCQVSRRRGPRRVLVAASVGALETVEYEVQRGAPPDGDALVTLREANDAFVLANGRLEARVPRRARGDEVPPPLIDLRPAGGPRLGAARWSVSLPLRSFRAEVLDRGPVLARVRLRWEFAGRAGLHGDVPAFCEVDVALAPGRSCLTLEERHEMPAGDFWEVDVAAGWSPERAEVAPHGRGPAGRHRVAVEDLSPGQTRLGDVLIRLQPRWSQAFDEGWLVLCDDGDHAAGAIPARAGRWHWPHDNRIEVRVRASGDAAILRCPVRRGRRRWFLLAGPQGRWSPERREAWLRRRVWWPLEKLVHDYVLEWPGREPEGDRRRFHGLDLYSSAMNPSGAMRGLGRRAMREAKAPGAIRELSLAQVILDDDVYGSYWNFWSPENPNFFTDFIRGGIAMTARLRDHPRFEELARRAEAKLREDVYHAVTLPGGAGQECPGYLAYALGTWRELAPLCRERLGFDPLRWPRVRAAAEFLARLSQPVAPGRRLSHPGGDTHPPGPDVLGIARDMHVDFDASALRSEELPGFGAVLRHRAGTERETYLAFKSGPSRGHYHGDQLSLHWCSDARPLAVDHMCSYAPRAGQEHMHNRLAFSTEGLPWANMDGHERLIAFRAAAGADIAVGQVASRRLRATTEYPPEDWDTYLPQERFDRPLVYRRTVVLVKASRRDFLVLRDEHRGPRVRAAFCLHVLTDADVEREGRRVVLDRLAIDPVRPADLHLERHDWTFEKGDWREATRGIRLESGARERGDFITFLWPGDDPPAIEPLKAGVRVGEVEVLFGGRLGEPAAVPVQVRRGEEVLVALSRDDIDLDRSQGETGLFVPDAGYPFGPIPEWLARQRVQVPGWAPAAARRARRHDLPAGERPPTPAAPPGPEDTEG